MSSEERKSDLPGEPVAVAGREYRLLFLPDVRRAPFSQGISKRRWAETFGRSTSLEDSKRDRQPRTPEITGYL